MASKLINQYAVSVKEKSDGVIAESINRYQADELVFGLANRVSRVKYGDTYSNVVYINYSTIKTADIRTGNIVQLVQTDKVLNAKSRLNPLCNFKTGVFDSGSLIGWAGHAQTALESDGKEGVVDLPKTPYAYDGASTTTRRKWDYTKANGTFNKVVEGLDCREDITSGECLYFEYGLTCKSGTPAQVYGFVPNTSGLTNSNQIILSNKADKCECRVDMSTGDIEYFAQDSAEYNTIPGNFTKSVTVANSTYYIGCDGYIYKINKSTLALEAKSERRVDKYEITSNNKSNLMYDGTDILYFSNYRGGEYTNSDNYVNTVNKDELTWSNETALNTKYSTIPDWLMYKYDGNKYGVSLKIENLSDGKYCLYDYKKHIALVFTDLNDITNTIIEDLTQVNVGGDALDIINNELYSFWINNSGGCIPSGNSRTDVGIKSFDTTLKMCPATSYQVYTVGEISGGYTKTENDQFTIELSHKIQ